VSENRLVHRFARASTVLAAGVAVVVVATGCSSSSTHTTSLPPTSETTSVATMPTMSPPTTRPPIACARPHSAGQFSQSFTFRGVARTFQLYVPRTYRGTKDVPVVFDFHGFGSNAVQQMVYGNFKPEADRDDFLIVAPDGQVPADRHFNLTAERGLQNDVQMVGALLDHIEATLCVDTHRVYATGMSDGGAMTSVLACTMSNRFAAFGAVAVVVSCGGSRPLAIAAFSGTADPVVPFNGGRVNCCGGAKLAGAPVAMASWAAHDHCTAAFHDVRLGTEVRRCTWSGCADGSTVVFYIIDGGGHTWPGSIPIASLGKTTTQIDASATIWRFFQQHELA
jgi:polyhydroxybutyrate depolymerase